MESDCVRVAGGRLCCYHVAGAGAQPLAASLGDVQLNARVKQPILSSC
ncbi:uncharacterized protein METZ01_LOCUS273246 [marine metagenome]|uniref:Uncharacterized protein n=1 Tax=marine metagenome TaxID=408172 RepID=A0A382KAF7_9ZZZZ